MNVQPIVEGYGEVSALPVLLRRLQQTANTYEFGIGTPIRRTRFELTHEDSLRKSIRLALLRPDTCGILVLFDSDDDCPAKLAPKIEAWAQNEAGLVSCAVVMATREYEAWFLASIESLRGQRNLTIDSAAHPNPESPRDAKKELELRMLPGASYSPTIDQAPLTARFDMQAAHLQCRSFRKMVSAFGHLVTGMGMSLVDWPPAAWTPP